MCVCMCVWGYFTLHTPNPILFRRPTVQQLKFTSVLLQKNLKYLFFKKLYKTTNNYAMKSQISYHAYLYCNMNSSTRNYCFNTVILSANIQMYLFILTVHYPTVVCFDYLTPRVVRPRPTSLRHQC